MAFKGKLATVNDSASNNSNQENKQCYLGIREFCFCFHLQTKSLLSSICQVLYFMWFNESLGAPFSLESVWADHISFIRNTTDRISSLSGFGCYSGKTRDKLAPRITEFCCCWKFQAGNKWILSSRFLVPSNLEEVLFHFLLHIYMFSRRKA